MNKMENGKYKINIDLEYGPTDASSGTYGLAELLHGVDYVYYGKFNLDLPDRENIIGNFKGKEGRTREIAKKGLIDTLYTIHTCIVEPSRGKMEYEISPMKGSELTEKEAKEIENGLTKKLREHN